MEPATKRISQIEPWLGEEEKKELLEVIDSGWFTEHKKTRELERQFAAFVGSPHATLVTSGTVALYVALKALGVQHGHEVIVPDLTFVASVGAIEACGARPVLVDIERETLCLDLEQTEKAITKQTKAIMPVHFNGRSPDMARLLKIAGNHGIPILEDACHTTGCWQKGKHLGTFGEIGAFSLSTPKIITTGQGGVLVTGRKALADRFVMLKDFGRDMSKKHEMAHAFEHQTVGYNFKFTEFQAAVGLAQMRKLEWRVRRKRQIFALMRELLREVKQVEFLDMDLEETVPWFNDCLLADANNRPGLISHLESRTIGTRVFYPPIHRLPAYSNFRGNWPVSEELSPRGLWLPSSSFLSDEDVVRVCRAIAEYFSRTA